MDQTTPNRILSGANKCARLVSGSEAARSRGWDAVVDIGASVLSGKPNLN
jgi:hypothetical protein